MCSVQCSEQPCAVDLSDCGMCASPGYVMAAEMEAVFRDRLVPAIIVNESSSPTPSPLPSVRVTRLALQYSSSRGGQRRGQALQSGTRTRRKH